MIKKILFFILFLTIIFPPQIFGSLGGVTYFCRSDAFSIGPIESYNPFEYETGGHSCTCDYSRKGGDSGWNNPPPPGTFEVQSKNGPINLTCCQACNNEYIKNKAEKQGYDEDSFNDFLLFGGTLAAVGIGGWLLWQSYGSQIFSGWASAQSTFSTVGSASTDSATGLGTMILGCCICGNSGCCCHMTGEGIAIQPTNIKLWEKSADIEYGGMLATLGGLVYKEMLSVKAKQKAINEAVNRLAEANAGVFQKTIKESARIENRFQNLKEFGSSSMSPLTKICDEEEDDLFIDMSKAKEQSKSVGKVFKKTANEYILNKQGILAPGHSKRIGESFLLDIEGDLSRSVDFIFPDNYTINREELENTINALYAVTDPFPPANVNEEKVDKEDNNYIAFKKAYITRKILATVPVESLSYLVAENTPIIEINNWYEKIAKATYGKDHIKTNSFDKKISYNEMKNTLVDFYFQSPYFLESIHVTTKTGLNRVKTQMGALKNMLVNDKRKLLKTYLALRTINASLSMDRSMDDELEDARAAIINN